jgi:predicted lipase
MERLQKFVIKKCDIQDDIETNEYDLTMNICCNIEEYLIPEKQNIKKASCVMSCLVYKYRTNTVLNINMYSNLVYGTYFNNDFLFIVFKGSSTLVDYITNVKFIQKNDSFNIPGEIHSGFYNVLENRFDEIMDIIEKHKHKKIIITGHSLGGALATVLFSYCLVKSPELDTYLYTFGSPRVGDKDFSVFISNSNKATRVVNKGDIVTMIPVFDYFHHKKEYKLGDAWFYLPSIKAHRISEYIKNL